MRNWLQANNTFITMTRVHEVSVTIDETKKTYTADFQTSESFARAWQSVLKRAYKSAEVRCCCSGMGDKRLAVKYFAGSDQFSLARFGRTAEQHAANCQYSSEDGGDGTENGSTTGVIKVQRDGSVKIRLEIGLHVRDPKAPDQVSTPAASRAASTTQAAMRLGGLLGYLWEEATLNQWRPYWAGKRNVMSVFRRIHTSAEAVVAGDLKLADQLLLPAMRSEDMEAKRNVSRVRAAIDNRRRLLVIAQLATYSPERAQRMSIALQIAGFHGIPRIFLAGGQWQRLCKRHQSAVSGWESGQATVVIAQIEVKEKEGRQSATLLDASLLGVSPQWIPVESSYERLIADRLVDEGRAFYKPLRYDPEGNAVHPDFVLLDCERGEVPMEVFGRTDDAYVARKSEKEIYYNSRYGLAGWWRWDATVSGAQQNIPAFPPISRKTADPKN